MVKIENECVGCDTYCINCGAKSVPHYYCDDCGDEVTLYDFDDKELCIRCVEKRLDIIEGSEC